MSPESRKGQPTCALIVSHTGRPPPPPDAILPFIALPRLSVPPVIAISLPFFSIFVYTRCNVPRPELERVLSNQLS